MTDPRLTELRTLFQKALELEFFTLPPYLCALYSIPDGKNLESVKVLQSVVMEEMLHMALVANVLNAIGGEPLVSPRLTAGGRVQKKLYPSRIPHVDLKLDVPLRKFCDASIRTFSAIEAPENPKDWAATTEGHFHSIGHFYDVVLDLLVTLVTDLGETAVFCGDPTRQLRPEHYYGGGGAIAPVLSLADAKDVIAQVAQQGEGRRQISNVTGDQERFGQPKEVAHFFRFEQLLAGRYYDRDDDVNDPTGPVLAVDWGAVYPMGEDRRVGQGLPRGADTLVATFEATYTELLDGLHKAFNGDPAEVRRVVPAMHRLRHEAVALMKVPRLNGTTLGPPMWFVQMT